MHAGVTVAGRPPAAPSEVPQLFDRRAVRRRLAQCARREPPGLLGELVEALLERFDEFQQSSEACLLLGARHHAIVRLVQRRRRINDLTVLAPDPTCLAGVPGAVGDEELLPFADEAFDTVLAPLALHRVNDLPGSLVQIRRLLRPGGLFLASLPAEETLCELRDVLLEAEAVATGGAALRVPPFADVQTLGNLLPRAGFTMPVADIDRRQLVFDNVGGLLQTLARAGERGGLQATVSGRLTLPTFRQACRLYEARHQHAGGGIAASFDLVTLTGRVPPGPAQSAGTDTRPTA